MNPEPALITKETTHSITDLVLDGLVTRLIEVCQSPFAEEHPTRVNLIRSGRLQASPTTNETNILIHDGSESDPLELYLDQSGLMAPTYEIGGGSIHILPVRIEINHHFPGVNDRPVARRYANIIQHRVRQAIVTMDLPTHPDTGQPRDDYGNALVHPPQIRKTDLREGGGKGHFIWRGEMLVQFLVHLEPLS